MPLPDSVKVGHATYELKHEPGLSQLTGATGVCGQDVQSILIDPMSGPDMQRETVLHEVLHAIFHGVGLKPYLEEVEKEADIKELEEKVVNAASGLLLQVLRDNPALMKFLRTP